MDLRTDTLTFSTNGHTHIIDLTDRIRESLRDSGLQEGQVTVFALGSTTGITTLEYEPGLAEHDVAAMFEELAPYGKNYRHNRTWGDDNGAAHLRSALTGTSYVAPPRGAAVYRPVSHFYIS
mgnify:CR=1 FL=1